MIYKILGGAPVSHKPVISFLSGRSDVSDLTRLSHVALVSLGTYWNCHVNFPYAGGKNNQKYKDKEDAMSANIWTKEVLP